MKEHRVLNEMSGLCNVDFSRMLRLLNSFM